MRRPWRPPYRCWLSVSPVPPSGEENDSCNGGFYALLDVNAPPPSKKVRMKEIEIQTAETNETLEKREKDWEQLCAKFDKNKEKVKDRDEWKKKFDKLQINFKEEEIKHLKDLYNARVSNFSPDVWP